MAPDIAVSDVRKTYLVPERDPGAAAALRSLIRRRMRAVHAVGGISFCVEPGEIVGFLGPNGAGKTTTLKMLSGLLVPSSGHVTVLGYRPWDRRPDFLRRITLVMGQRSQLAWDIPALDSYRLNQAIYEIPEGQFRQTVAEFVDLLDLEPILRKPVRNLSLGERMKVELAASLLHRPRVLFLDEPTIGLDVTAQRRIRQFIAEYNRRHSATVLLTSHYMADVEALCKRVIVIDRGALLLDGSLQDLVRRYAASKLVVVEADAPIANAERYGELVDADGGRLTLRVAREQAADITSRLLHDHPIRDLTVVEPPIEEVIDRVFTEARK